MTNPTPNVVSREAATVARLFVFAHRAEEGIDPQEVVTRLIEAGHGSEIPTDLRRKRLKTWALQVLRRLRKHGWLDEAGWGPTAALRACTKAKALAKQAPRQEVVAARPQPEPPEFWRRLIEDWVFHHRDREFGVSEVVVAVVQEGFGDGEIGDRLDSGRDLAEKVLHTLEQAGLIQFRTGEELWQPTELLRSWP